MVKLEFYFRSKARNHPQIQYIKFYPPPPPFKKLKRSLSWSEVSCLGWLIFMIFSLLSIWAYFSALGTRWTPSPISPQEGVISKWGGPSRGIRSLGVMGEGPGNLRFVATSRRVVVVAPSPPKKKMTLGHLDKTCQTWSKNDPFQGSCFSRNRFFFEKKESAKSAGRVIFSLTLSPHLQENLIFQCW